METIGEKIQRLRKLKRLSLRELAKGAGCSFNSISDWENGRSEPRATSLKKIAEFMNVNLDYFFVEEIGMLREKLASYTVNKNGNVRPIPVYPATTGVFEDYEGGNALEYRASYCSDNHSFFIKANNDRLIGGDIKEGDFLMISPNSEIIDGNLCFCCIDNRATVARFSQRDNTIILSPINSAYPPIAVTDGNAPIFFRIIKIEKDV